MAKLQNMLPMKASPLCNLLYFFSCKVFAIIAEWCRNPRKDKVNRGKRQKRALFLYFITHSMSILQSRISRKTAHVINILHPFGKQLQICALKSNKAVI